MGKQPPPMVRFYRLTPHPPTPPKNREVGGCDVQVDGTSEWISIRRGVISRVYHSVALDVNFPSTAIEMELASAMAFGHPT